ncbi:MAG: hypothetical protein ACKO3O_09380, partial [Gammaproteobacteria bacterium]
AASIKAGIKAELAVSSDVLSRGGVMASSPLISFLFISIHSLIVLGPTFTTPKANYGVMMVVPSH